jgi:hypothetical protein
MLLMCPAFQAGDLVADARAMVADARAKVTRQAASFPNGGRRI